MIEIYIKQDCPYCHNVLRRTAELGLRQGKDFKIVNASKGSKGREVILEVGGIGQVPFLIDGKTHMYESEDIIKYIEEKFKQIKT